MSRHQIVFTILLGLVLTTNSAPSKVDQLRENVFHTIDTVWHEISYPNNVNNQPDLKDTDLMYVFRTITSNISQVENATKFTMPATAMTSLQWAQVTQEISNLAEYFKTFERLQAEPIRWRHELAWTDTALYFLDNTDKGINNTLRKLHSYTMGEPYSVFDQIIQVGVRETLCEFEWNITKNKDRIMT